MVGKIMTAAHLTLKVSSLRIAAFHAEISTVGYGLCNCPRLHSEHSGVATENAGT